MCLHAITDGLLKLLGPFPAHGMMLGDAREPKGNGTRVDRGMAWGCGLQPQLVAVHPQMNWLHFYSPAITTCCFHPEMFPV